MGAHQAWWASGSQWPAILALGLQGIVGVVCWTGVLNGQPYCLSQENRPWPKLNWSNLI